MLEWGNRSIYISLISLSRIMKTVTEKKDM